MHTNDKNKRISGIHTLGFTLVELLIAISVLALSILATFSAVSNNVKGQNFAEDQVIAYYLADEGIEYIRNVRDQNGIANIAALGSGGSQVSWLNGIAGQASDPCYPGKTCIVDSPLHTITSCNGGASTCPFLNINSTSGLYGYTSGSPWVTTQFTRSITISPVNGSLSTEAIVTCTVTWRTNGVTKNYVASEDITEWQ